MTALSKHNLVTRIFMIWWCEHMKVTMYKLVARYGPDS